MCFTWDEEQKMRALKTSLQGIAQVSTLVSWTVDEPLANVNRLMCVCVSVTVMGQHLHETVSMESNVVTVSAC